MKHFLLFSLLAFFFFSTQARNSKKRNLKRLYVAVQTCSAYTYYQAQYVEIFAAYEGDRCNPYDIYGSMYVNGQLYYEGEGTGALLDAACGPVSCA